MSNLTLSEFNQMKARVDELPRAPVGYVVKSSLLSELTATMRKIAIQEQAFAIPLYSDDHQEEDILAFYDNLTLRCYLVRRECPHAWGALVISRDRETARAILDCYLKKIEAK